MANENVGGKFRHYNLHPREFYVQVCAVVDKCFIAQKKRNYVGNVKTVAHKEASPFKKYRFWSCLAWQTNQAGCSKARVPPKSVIHKSVCLILTP